MPGNRKMINSSYHLVLVIPHGLILVSITVTLCKKKKRKYRIKLGLSVGSPGDYKVNLIPSLIGPFLELTLVPQPDLRNVLIPVFHDMMDSEERRSGNFKQVMTAL